MPDIQKISIAITAELSESLKQAVESGEYATTREAIREAIREWQYKREVRSEDLNRLRAQWSQGKRSGSATPLDLKKFRAQAANRLKRSKADVA